MKINSEFADLLRAFNDGCVRYLVVGAHAVAVHARPRATNDFDVWIANDRENAVSTYRALAAFGAPLDRLTIEELATDDVIFQIGIAPIRIDIITSITGVAFGDAWPNRFATTIDGVAANVIGRDDLIRNKIATGRSKDLADVERLRDDA